MTHSIKKRQEDTVLNKVNELLLRAIVGTSTAYLMLLIFHAVR